MIFFRFLLKIKSFLVKKPQKELTWTSVDLQKGKDWAKTQPHPFLKSKTLLDFCDDHNDSVYTIRNLNNFIKK